MKESYTGYTHRAPTGEWNTFTMICRVQGVSIRKKLNELIAQYNQEHKDELVRYVESLNITR